MSARPIPGGVATLRTDRFARNRNFVGGVASGRSAYESPTLAECPAKQRGGSLRGDDVGRLVFDPAPAACGGFNETRVDFSSRR